jgi:hypothetical protein
MFREGLFETSSGLIDFVVITEELQQIATYADSVLTFTSQKLNELKEEFPVYEDDWEGGEQVLKWESNVRFVTPATLLMTFYVFFEKSLKNLCYSFTRGTRDYEIPLGERFKIKPKNESNVEAQIRYLREDCGFEFTLSDDESRMIRRSAEIRNDYAHGDWNKVKIALREVDLTDVLRVVSNIFRELSSVTHLCSDELLGNILAVAAAIDDDGFQAHALAEIAARLPDPERTEIFNEAKYKQL